MLEAFYGVESRTEQPRKKVKIEADTNGSEKPHSNSKFNISSTGYVGEYMNPAKDPDAANKPTLLPAGVVDLTNASDDDDDDLQITGSSNIAEKVVCFGMTHVELAAHKIPKPRNKVSPLYSKGEWPPILCSVKRLPEDAKTTTIRVSDCHGVYFANVEQRLARVLAPAMDGFPKLRTVTRILNRRKALDEWPHQPCSASLKATMIIYGRRCDAEKIGRLFGQNNIWFMDTTLRDQGVELLNPHKQTKGSSKISHTTSGNVRTVRETMGSEEDAAQNVTRIFQQYSTEKLPETEAPSTVLTPLLVHQKQALTFMLKHETPQKFDDDASSSSGLWQKKFKRSGLVYYEEAVSNIIIEDGPPPQALGGLLADVMGLGKTLESLTLIAATQQEAIQFGQSQLQRDHKDKVSLVAATKGTLIVCPMSTVANWENQIKEHLDPSFKWYTHHGSNRLKNAYHLREFDIVITTYGTLMSEARREANECLRTLKWFRVILDEAHTIREPSAQQSHACYELEAQRRWALTGTPIQNKLADLGSLCQFLRLFPYDTASNFNYYIGKRAADGDPSFLLKLRIFIDSFTLRRNRDQINLPGRTDYEEVVKFSTAEAKLHEFFRERARISVAAMTKEEGAKQNLQVSVLKGITILRLISAHGRDLLKENDLVAYKGSDATEPIDLEDDSGLEKISELEAYELYKMMADADFDVCCNCDKPIAPETPSVDAEDESPRGFVLPCRDLVCPDCFRNCRPLYEDEEDAPVNCKFCEKVTAAQFVAIRGSVGEAIERMQASRNATPETEVKGYVPHSKTKALVGDVKQMTEESDTLEKRGEAPLKCVIFSEFTSHLNLIGRALNLEGFEKNWGRIDGSMSLPKRKKVLEAFDEDNNMTILLASIKAAGQGLNLTVASRAFIMEPLWNPAAEAQAVDRIYRIGQKRDVIIKRYHMQDSIEEVIIKLAKDKQKLAEVSLNRNHKALSKKEQREQHYNEIRSLFEKGSKRR
jgi:SNF2 family DNA or RNA helicase